MDRFLLTLKIAYAAVTTGGYVTFIFPLAAISFDELRNLHDRRNLPLRGTTVFWHASATIYEEQDAASIAFPIHTQHWRFCVVRWMLTL